jgi:hypothetical protein
VFGIGSQLSPGKLERRSHMDRRKFSKVMGAAVAGMVAGSKLAGRKSQLLADEKAAKHVCGGTTNAKGRKLRQRGKWLRRTKLLQG